MSAPGLTTRKAADLEVMLDDSTLENELFSEMDPALEEELFGSSDSDAHSTSLATSSDVAAASPATTIASDSQDKNTDTNDLDDDLFCDNERSTKQTTAATLQARDDEKRLKLERRNEALQKANPSPKPIATPETTSVSIGDAVKPEKNAVQLAQDEEKRAKLERRNRALQEKAKPSFSQVARPPVSALSSVSQQKRKRGDKEEADGKATKRAVSETDAVEMKKKTPTPVPSAQQKRKREADDEEGVKPAKRGLTDGVAADIAQNREHTFSEDAGKVQQRRDSVAVETVRKDVKSSGTEEQHLTPPDAAVTGKMVPTGLEIEDDDDEFTRMLKEELAKPSEDAYSDDEQEDPLVEEIMQPLTEPEKHLLATTCKAGHDKGKAWPTEARLRGMVQMMVNNPKRGRKILPAKGAKGANAPKKSSPLANDGVMAEEQEIDQQPKLAPKSRRPAPSAARTTTAVDTTPATSAVARKQGEDAVAPSAAAKKTSAPLSTAPTPSAAPATPEDYSKLKNAQLQDRCRERGLTVGGNKRDLVLRLQAYDDEVATGEAPTGVKAPPQKKAKKQGYSWMQEAPKRRA